MIQTFCFVPGGCLHPFKGSSRRVVDMQTNREEMTGAEEVLTPASTGSKVEAAELLSLPKPQPQFGSCKGMLVIVSDDDEYLEHFKDYMP